MESVNTFDLKKQFERFEQSITQMACENQNERLLRISQYSAPFSMKTISLSSKSCLYFPKQHTMITSCSSSQFLIYAFCLIENDVLSTISLRIIRKATKQIAEKCLKQLYLKVTAMKLLFTEQNKLLLITATKCGHLFSYKGFESNEVEIEAIKISSFPIIDLISSSTEKVFTLAENGSIYLINLKENRVFSQFRLSLPQLDDKNLFLFIDKEEKHIGCAFGFGSIIIWEVPGQKNSKVNGTEKDEEESQQTNDLKAQSYQEKENYHRKAIFKSKASLTSFAKDRIRWISFIGQFLILLTGNDILKIIATNLNGKLENYQLFFVISEVKLLSNEEQQTKINKISHISQFTHGLWICINTFDKSQHLKFKSAKLRKYIFTDSMQLKVIVEYKLPVLETVQSIFWNEFEKQILCKHQDGYSLIENQDLIKE